MRTPESLQSFASGTHAALFHVGETLADSFGSVGLRCDVQQALVGLGVLYNRFGFAINGKYERVLGFFEMFQELCGISAESRHSLNVFF